YTGHDLLGAVERGGVRKLNVEEEGSLILLRKKSRWQVREDHVGAEEGSAQYGERDGRDADQQSDRPAIAGARRLQRPPKPGEWPPKLMQNPSHAAARCTTAAGPELSEQGDAECRAERQSDDGRNDQGGGEGHRKLLVKLTVDARQECGRDDNGEQYKGGG